MRKLIIVTKKWGRNFTGATLATQYFTERWIEHFDRVYVYTLQCGEAIKQQNLIVHQFKSEYQLLRHLAHDASEIKCFNPRRSNPSGAFSVERAPDKRAAIH